MEEKLKVTNDIVFQRIFGKTGNEKIIKKFLERILGITIEELSLDTNKRLIGEEINDKIGRIDVKARLKDGTKVIIEMQVARYKSMPERLLYYWAKTYTGDLKQGEKYDNLEKTIAILISVENIERFNKIEEGHTKWQIYEEKHVDKKLTDKLEIHVIELGKLRNEENSKKIDWLSFIKGDKIDMKRDLDKELKEAIEELEKITADPEMRELYYQREKDLRDKISFASAEREEGIKQGIKQGIEKGIEQNKREIILNMHKRHMKIEDICEIVNLEKEKVQEIINQE